MQVDSSITNEAARLKSGSAVLSETCRLDAIRVARTRSSLFKDGFHTLFSIGCLALSSVIFLFAALSIYLLVWGIFYRSSHAPARLIDFRRSATQKPYYVALCSGLASNPHGFPGHCFVVWSDKYPVDFENAESRGFVPRHYYDQIPSLFKTVPGALVDRAACGNMRMFDALIVVVDRERFDRSIHVRNSFEQKDFRVGTSDCVAFTDDIANSLGLRRPNGVYQYPQDYIRELKELNGPH